MLLCNAAVQKNPTKRLQFVQVGAQTENASGNCPGILIETHLVTGNMSWLVLATLSDGCVCGNILSPSLKEHRKTS